MSQPTFVLLYVESPARSEKFYANLLDSPALESSPTFAMFFLQPGLMLGLWLRDGVEPASATPAGSSELAFTVENDEAVLAKHADWQQRGLTILQAPTAMDFGFTFTAADPDGHRLRVFAPAA